MFRVIRLVCVPLICLLLSAAVAAAATISGRVTNEAGEPVAGATIVILNVAAGTEIRAETDADGRFRAEVASTGQFRVAIDQEGFASDAQTVTVARATDTVEVTRVLRLGGFSSDVTVTATRAMRDQVLLPLAVDKQDSSKLFDKLPTTTGEALIQAAGIVPVGSGPFQQRPRLRGLDSTRVLVLIDGERLNNARTATDRAGAEVGLAETGSLESVEVVSGSGSVLYGTDALAGTINLITNQPSFTDQLSVNYGVTGFYSSNENGRRGSAMVGVANRRFAINLNASLEQFDDYRAGNGAENEDTREFFRSGQLRQADTIDDNFGFTFRAFPDPFNAPYARPSADVGNSGAEGNNLNIAGMFAIDSRQSIRVKYLRRHVTNVGFPDFSAPTFFQKVSLPYSNLDRVSARYEAQSVSPRIANVKISGYFQEQARLLRNDFPVQFPVPSPGFFPIAVNRLNIVSDTEQRVRTPGFDAQATFIGGTKHLLTLGAMSYADRSKDDRITTTRSSQIGSVTLGPRGPQANVFATPIVGGTPSVSRPVRVPNSSFRDIGVFAQDEWDLHARVHLVGGVRVDSFRVRANATPGYDVAPLLVGARPPLDPEALPDNTGDTVSRAAVTGEIGAVFRLSEIASAQAHYGRSYRHPNLEELLFAGPATIGAIVPNLKVEPETGHNVDVGVSVRASRAAAQLTYFRNRYDGFISTEIVTNTAGGPVSQAINLADVRIQGLEARGEVRFGLPYGIWTLTSTAAYTHGEVLSGANPLTGASLAGTPQDNITPFKVMTTMRYSDPGEHFWMEYSNRTQTDVTRVASTLIESPFLIAQDLLSLDGFSLHRLAWGVNLSKDRGRMGVVFALDNLTDEYYREHFQFAPGRGRSFTVGLSVKGH